eukprot:CAMPEP_0117018418 /NCGR_PEP_ID=MMETSP0472-20121206/14249_1 /TAXON_ID=693140 ORGANISM="Tiarina fusus, Strain LIS" /NCGR_SAMPLE_ID=MMETSP0472 /ASSEMBLY_ACC=CAM_ASM_000603 /LENGTH=401 /DNA_ID=CAMNT_0004723069 /DNA_START=162 /DNA_END=1368 /DNA_ORIENTATION=+
MPNQTKMSVCMTPQCFSTPRMLFLLVLSLSRLVLYTSNFEYELTSQITIGQTLVDEREQDVSAEARILEMACPKDSVPPFITYGVHAPGVPGLRFWKKRWGKDDMGNAIRILYSSLSRTYNCAVELHVHTNLKQPVQQLLHNDASSTMGTRMKGLEFHPLNETAWKKNNAYLNPKLVERPSNWLALSRSKIDTLEAYLPPPSAQEDDEKGAEPGGLLPVWVDLDTLILDKSAVGHHIPGRRPWAHCYFRTGRTSCYGDIFSVDQSTIDDIRSMEREMIRNGQPLPRFDLQGYFGLLLEQNSSRLEIIQNSFGFDCSGGKHPFPDIIKSQIKKRQAGGLECPISRTKMVGKVGSISFTAPSFKEFFFDGDIHASFDIIEDRDARAWLDEFYFYPSNPEISQA